MWYIIFTIVHGVTHMLRNSVTDKPNQFGVRLKPSGQ